MRAAWRRRAPSGKPLAALEVLPQQLVTLTSRASQPLPPDLAWSEAAHNAKRAAGPAGGSMFS